MADVLITGGAGNLGRTLAEALRAAGHSITVLDLPSRDFGSFEGWSGTRVLRGDILDPRFLSAAVPGAEWVFHLAAILPPASEIDRERTFRVNVEGTRALLDACTKARVPPRLVFASSVSVYGNTTAEPRLVGAGHPVAPTEWYARSKVEAERLLFSSGLPWVNLRISGIAIPVFLDPPEPWPFQEDQRIELVALSDLVTALVGVVGREEAIGRTLLIAGGRTWQVKGGEYVRRWAEIMQIASEEMRFLDRPGWLAWYDTEESERLLGYQRTRLEDFFSQLEAAVAAELP